MHGAVHTPPTSDPRYRFLDTMPNLPWLCNGRQRLRSGYDGADVHVVQRLAELFEESASVTAIITLYGGPGTGSQPLPPRLFCYELKQRHVSTELARGM